MDIQHIDALRLAIDAATILLCSLVWLGIVVFLWLKKKTSYVYLTFFTIFSVYLFKVLDYTQFQFQSLLVVNYLKPGALMLQGGTADESMNLLPLITLRPGDLKTSLLNILLMIPFGFGLPFITNLRMKNVVLAGALFSIGIEALQLITGLMANMTFRVVDINDVIFNTLGTVIGYLLFVAFMRIFRHRTSFANPFLRYIAERPQMNKKDGKNGLDLVMREGESKP